MTQATLNWQTAAGHQVLAAAGKKVLRPGGRAATECLFTWADIQPGDRVLELASSFGENAIALAQRFGARVVGIEQNPDSVAIARDAIAKAGLSEQITLLQGDIFHLDQITEQFDYVLAEAILTMQSIPAKTKLLKLVSDRLKPGGLFLSHELVARDHEAELHTALSSALRVNATPLTASGWIDAFQTAGLAIVRQQQGDMGLLTPRQMIRDEGLAATLTILWNVATRPALRQRILTMRRVFQKHRADLGYILCCAQRPSGGR